MFLNDYDIGENLYQSSTTAVCRAINKRSGQNHVLKILQGDHPSTLMIQRFRQEYDILKMFAERNIASVIKPLDLFFENNTWIIVLEDFGAISLSQSGLIGSFDTESFLSIALQLVESLELVHQNNIIHCDINPSNILINRSDGRIKLIDFGISTWFSRMDTAYQHPNTMEGTLGYISPEQTGRMNRSIDFRSDFYSLGVTFYELVTGVIPFQNKDNLELIYSHIARDPAPPKVLNPDLPDMVSDIILKLMARVRRIDINPELELRKIC